MAYKLILASQSPRRAALMKQAGLQFEVMPSNSDEESVPHDKPAKYVKTIAKMKANAIAAKVSEGIIIAADTTVYLDGKIYNKPKDRAEAIEMLKLFSGKVHKVTSGLCVINKYTGKTVTKAVTTSVKFRELSDRLISWYVDTGEPYDKAGGYGIQAKGGILVEWVKGDYYNVTGLPLVTLMKILEEMDAF